MKTINIVATHFYPEKSAGANRVTSLVEKLSKDAIVNVIFLSEKGKVLEDSAYSGRFNSNVRLYRIKQNNFQGNKFLRRIYNETLYSLKLNIKNANIKSDVSVFSIPYLQLLPISAFFSIFLKRKTIVEIRDLIWLYLDFSDSTVLNMIKKMLDYICRWSLYRFDHVVTVTPSQLRYLGVKGFVIENGLESAKYEQLVKLPVRNEDKSITVTYAGTIGYPQNLLTLVKAALLLKEDDRFKFKIAGKGNMLSDVTAFIKEHRLENVEYVGEIDWKGMIMLYSDSDVLYAQLKDTPSFRTAQPSKIFEYASTGLPIIFGGVGESSELMDKLEGCYAIEPDRPELIVEVLEKIYLLNKRKYYENIEYIKSNCLREEILNKYSKLM